MVKEIFHVFQLKKGDRVKQKEIKRFGRCQIKDYGILEYIEPYSTNRNTGHFKTKDGEIITLMGYEVEKCKK